MNLGRLMFGEIRYRRLGFLLGAVSAALAAGVIVGSVTLLRGHDVRTERLVEEREVQIRQEMAKMEDDYRVIMKRMGYNVLVLHKDQDLAELHAKGYPTVTMAEAEAEKLAAVGLPSLNHLLPILQRRIKWPEKGEEILLTGTRGQMRLAGRGVTRSPIMAPVPTGSVALGNTIAARVDVTAGERIELMGASFRVERVEPTRGTSDDMAVWVDLAQAQEWLKLPGRISGILALECVCHADALGQIVSDVQKVLPQAQVFEFGSIVRGRAEARKRASETRETALKGELEQRLALREERQRLMATVKPLAVVGAGVWMLLLFYGNARDRRSEIGMLRAIGVRQNQILTLFLGKALLMGGLGSLLGIVGGTIAGVLAAGSNLTPGGILGLAGGGTLLLALLMGPALGGLAVAWPALSAVRRDPAQVLGEE